MNKKIIGTLYACIYKNSLNQNQSQEQEQNRITEKKRETMQKVTDNKKRIYSMQRIDRQFKKCHAIGENGYSCRCKAMSGELFCHAHLLQGFGLFTLAVLAILEPANRQ